MISEQTTPAPMTSAQTARRLTLALFALCIFQGCDGGPGDFCHRDSDCRTALRCSSADPKVRGICVYRQAPASKDGSVDLVADLLSVDLPTDGAASDVTPDAGAGDDATADAADLSLADGVAKDMDARAADTTATAPDSTADQRAPDQQVADSLATDSPGQ